RTASEVRLADRLGIARVDQEDRRVARLLQRLTAPVADGLVIETEAAIQRAQRVGLVAGVAGKGGIAAAKGTQLIAWPCRHVAGDVGDGAAETAAAEHDDLGVPV